MSSVGADGTQVVDTPTSGDTGRLSADPASTGGVPTGAPGSGRSGMSTETLVDGSVVRRPMRPRVVRLVDLGLDDRFDASMSFIQATLRSINAGADSPIVEVEFVRSRDELTVGMAFTAPAAVLHVMAHGGQAQGPTFSSDDERTQYTLDQLAQQIGRASCRE